MLSKLLAVVFALFALGACGGDNGPTDTDSESITGHYGLLTVEGQLLPYTIFDTPGEKLEILEGSIEIRDSGTLTSEATWRSTVDGAVETFTSSENGTWTRSGSTLTISWDGGCTDNATISGTRITIADDCDMDLTWVFEKLL
jgi:hypothetical protein